MSNDITELRSALFDTLRDLKAGNMDIERAKAINDTAQTIINSAKVEIDHMKIAGGNSGFIAGSGAALIERTGSGTRTVTSIAGGTVTQHRMA